MERRVTVVVALFVGAIALLGTWLLLTTDPTVPRSGPTAQIGGDGEEQAPAATARERELRRLQLDDPRLAGPGSREVSIGKPANIERLRSRIDIDGSRTTAGTYALDADGIADAVDARRTQLEDCYGTALLHAPALPPSLPLSLEVTPSPGASWGHVTSVDVPGVEDAEVFATCAKGALGGVRFATSEPTTVTVPLDLGRP